MKRSTFITWEQLKVGSLILAGAAVLGVAVMQLGAATRLFEARYTVYALIPNASGLREGGSVMVAGLMAGSVRRIEFLPPDSDTLRNLRLTIEINRDLQEQIRGDSHGRLRTLGLLGDKVLDISPGTPRYAALADGDTLMISESLDYDQVIGQASGAVGDMVQLTRDLRAITGTIVRGEGTMGQLLTSRTLYDQLGATLVEANQLLDRMQRPGGTFGRLLDDPTLYNRINSLTLSMDSILVAMNSGQGTLSRMLHDDSLYVRMVGVTASADSILGRISRGEGFAGRMINDQELYDRLNKTVTDLNAILEDVRRNPQRYTRGMIRVF